jgi:hypothetical protein
MLDQDVHGIGQMEIGTSIVRSAQGQVLQPWQPVQEQQQGRRRCLSVQLKPHLQGHSRHHA